MIKKGEIGMDERSYRPLAGISCNTINFENVIFANK